MHRLLTAFLCLFLAALFVGPTVEAQTVTTYETPSVVSYRISFDFTTDSSTTQRTRALYVGEANSDSLRATGICDNGAGTERVDVSLDHAYTGDGTNWITGAEIFADLGTSLVQSSTKALLYQRGPWLRVVANPDTNHPNEDCHVTLTLYKRSTSAPTGGARVGS